MIATITIRFHIPSAKIKAEKIIAEFITLLNSVGCRVITSDFSIKDNNNDNDKSKNNRS